MLLDRCPRCGSSQFRVIHSRQQMGRETDRRSRFVHSRFDHRPEPAELMDLTRFMHGRPEPLAACIACGMVVRDEYNRAAYPTDVYDMELLKHLYPRYLAAFRKKGVNYRELLPARAEVLEIGSHLGAFLAAAEEWNWRPTGVDVGEYTSAFARRQGLRVKRSTIEDARVPTASADGVFIWNCFEQLERPAETLGAARAILKPHGMLVIRTPNFRFYEDHRCELRALAYNNLLGFPYLIGYTPATLEAVARRNGFEPVAAFDATLLTMPFPELTPAISKELDAENAPYESAQAKAPRDLSGPWIEVAFRRSTGRSSRRNVFVFAGTAA